MNKVYKYFLVGVLLYFPLIGMCADTSGTISTLRATTDLASVSQQRMFFIQLSNALHPNCNYITVDPNNEYFASALLSAEARGKAVKIWYDEINADLNKLCKANTIQITP